MGSAFLLLIDLSPVHFPFSSLFANIGWDSRVIIMIYFLYDFVCVYKYG